MCGQPAPHHPCTALPQLVDSGDTPALHSGTIDETLKSHILKHDNQKVLRSWYLKSMYSQVVLAAPEY
jgi:hypothetical protein